MSNQQIRFGNRRVVEQLVEIVNRLVLRMTREEIGSYLGLKLETVSRAFSRFQEDGLLEVKQRDIRVLDEPGLRRLLNDSPC